MIYIFENPETGEQKEVAQAMNDVHEYNADGKVWKRIYTIPKTAIDTKIDPFSAQNFVDKTGKGAKGTIGDLWDRSREYSEKRKDKLGYDPIADKAVSDYENKYKVTHPSKISKLE